MLAPAIPSVPPAAPIATPLTTPLAAPPAAPPSAPPRTPAEELLRGKQLAVPVDGVARSALSDTFADPRGGRGHEAIDIAAATGTRVFAVDDGTVVKLFRSVPGGITVYQFDPSGTLLYYYAHLDRYAEGLREGALLRRCDLIGYVGTTGNAPANAPHLHFAVAALGAQRRWWQGTALNPYPALRAAPAGDSPCA
ncbi:MAG: M23 family metallopeptidase [Caldimonas sp.]